MKASQPEILWGVCSTTSCFLLCSSALICSNPCFYNRTSLSNDQMSYTVSKTLWLSAVTLLSNCWLLLYLDIWLIDLEEGLSTATDWSLSQLRWSPCPSVLSFISISLPGRSMPTVRHILLRGHRHLSRASPRRLRAQREQGNLRCYPSAYELVGCLGLCGT